MPMKRPFALVAAISICGCAAQPQIWVNPAATQAQAQSDEARCDYEANAATATYGSGETARRHRRSDRARIRRRIRALHRDKQAQRALHEIVGLCAAVWRLHG